MEQKCGFTGEINTAMGERSDWMLLGPGGGGAQFTPSISPHDPQRMLVACDMTGAYLTNDGGRTWAEFNLRAGVHSFAFDLVDPETIYAGSTGLYRSVDGGKSWRLVFPSPDSLQGERMIGDHADHCFFSGDNWPGGVVQYIQVDEYDNKNIYIGVYTNKKLSIFFSDDYCVSWREIATIEGCKFHAIYLDPTPGCGERRFYCFTDKEARAIPVSHKTPQAMLKLPGGTESIAHVACGVNPETGMPVFYLIASRTMKREEEPEAALWKSEDRGRSWQVLNIALDNNASTFAFPPPELTILAVPEKEGRTIYVGVGKYLEYGCETGAGSVHAWFGVIKSTDGGQTWRWVLKSDYETDAANLKEGWAERDYGLPWYLTGPKGVGPIGLGVCAVNADICCTTDLSSSFLTTDGGQNWKQVYSTDNLDGSVSSRGLEVTTCYGVHFDPFDRSHLAISYTDIGMFHSKNGGRTWFHSIRGLPVAWGNTCYWIVFDPDVKGRSWSAWGGSHDLPRPKMFRSGNFHYSEGGVCKSDDNMGCWQLSNAGMPGNTVVTHLVLDVASPSGNRTLYAAGFDRGVYKSTDDGASWVLKNNGIHGNLNAWRLTQLPDGTLYLLVARGLRGPQVIDGAIYKSADGAEHWGRVPLPTGANAPNDLIADPVDPKRMYLCCWPTDEGDQGSGGGLYATQDGGHSWCSIFNPAAHVYAAAIHPQNPSVLFLVTFDSAAWYSEDAGKTWEQIRGYDFKWGHRPVVDPYNSDMLYITTFGSSVWHGPWKSQ